MEGIEAEDATEQQGKRDTVHSRQAKAVEGEQGKKQHQGASRESTEDSVYRRAGGKERTYELVDEKEYRDEHNGSVREGPS